MSIKNKPTPAEKALYRRYRNKGCVSVFSSDELRKLADIIDDKENKEWQLIIEELGS